jgi:glucose/arabinose dehydrogenase/mono/diheme cytochrome c family protein
VPHTLPPAATAVASAYATEDAFPGLTFTHAVAATTPPGETNRLFVVERQGLIRVIPDLHQPHAEAFLDLRPLVRSDTLEEGLLGLAFHPQYASNGWLYVYFTGNTNTTQGVGRHDILARFSVSPTNENQAVRESFAPLIVQYDQSPSHNGGCLAFGPDGYLYFSNGDEGAVGYGNTQRIDWRFYSGIFRIDVDQRSGNLPPQANRAVVGGYSVPADNPFVGADAFNGLPVDPTKVRTEFFAVGLRNPWRFAFDPFTGELYGGDVGELDCEEVNHYVAGGNYGYPYWEGVRRGPILDDPPAGFAPLAPIFSHFRRDVPSSMRAWSIIYGFVYRGTRFPDLVGRHIYGDFGSFNLWAAWQDGTGQAQIEPLGSHAFYASGFGEDPRNGDVLILQAIPKPVPEPAPIRRLVAAPPPGPSVLIPPTLADTGLFADVEALTVAEGLIPYELNVPFWSDRAHKRRWVGPPAAPAAFQASAPDRLDAPAGTVWIKHFDLDLVEGDPQSRIRLETRVLMQNGAETYGVTYRYGGTTTNATLVSPFGLEEDIEVLMGGSVVTQRWVYPGWSDCLRCHNAAAGYALGFHPAQLEREVARQGGGYTNQLAWLVAHGLVTAPEVLADRGPRLAAAGETDVSLEHRARSVLHANCSSCHFPGGPALDLWDARIGTPLAATGLIRPDSGYGDSLLVPGDPDGSRLIQLMEGRPSRMPPLGSTVVDTNGVAVIRAWVESLDGFRSYEDWVTDYWGTLPQSDFAPQADADGDWRVNYVEYVTGSDPQNAQGPRPLQVDAVSGLPRVHWTREAGVKTVLECAPSLEGDWTAVPHPANHPLPAAVTTTYVYTPDLEGSNQVFRLRYLPR